MQLSFGEVSTKSVGARRHCRASEYETTGSRLGRGSREKNRYPSEDDWVHDHALDKAYYSMDFGYRHGAEHRKLSGDRYLSEH